MFEQVQSDVEPAAAGARQADRSGDRLMARLGRVLGGRGERRTRLRTLTLIRWVAIVGQAFTIAFVHFSLEFRLPLAATAGERPHPGLDPG